MLLYTTEDRIVIQHVVEEEKNFLETLRLGFKQWDNGWMAWWTFDTAEYETLNPDKKALVIA